MNFIFINIICAKCSARVIFTLRNKLSYKSQRVRCVNGMPLMLQDKLKVTKTGTVRINVTAMRVRVTIVAVEKQ
jgi:hypothetical protein